MMRKLIAAFIAASAVMVLTTTSPSASAHTVVATKAASTTGFNACSVPLDHDRRKIYKFKRGSSTLGFGRVVVIATQQYHHRYCVRFKLGGRTVTHRWDRVDYVRANGTCGSEIGGMGSGPHRNQGYDKTLIVPDKTCVHESYGIKSGGRWYFARFMRSRA